MSAPPNANADRLRYRSAAPPPQTPQRNLQFDITLEGDNNNEDSRASTPFSDLWADEAKLYATIQGALRLSATAFQALLLVPRESRDARPPSAGHSLRRSRSSLVTRVRLDFVFGTGSRSLRRHGMPMYALANASEDELARNMVSGKETVRTLLDLRRIQVRFEWPLPPGSEEPQVVHHEWLKIDVACTRAQLGMAIARLFYQFVETHRTSGLGMLEDYPWLLRPDAFYRVWLLGLERVEGNLFVVDMKYVKYYPHE